MNNFKQFFFLAVLGLSIWGCKKAETPFSTWSLVKVSGDQQIGEVGHLLEPIVVRVLNGDGEPQEGVRVLFRVTSGGGSLISDTARTDTSGYAYANWTIGPDYDVNTMEVTSLDDNGMLLQNTPMQFVATAGMFATDNDGNVYSVIRIGNAYWMGENLRSTHYRNGDPIPNLEPDSLWGTTTEGAYSVFDNAAVNDTLYGKLYNGYAITDYRNICPPGWHVPSDGEWGALEGALGGGNLAGGAIKSLNLWLAPNTGATNSSQFTALPGGYRALDGPFSLVNKGAAFWSNSPAVGGSGFWFRNALFNSSALARSSQQYRSGLSVRLVKD